MKAPLMIAALGAAAGTILLAGTLTVLAATGPVPQSVPQSVPLPVQTQVAVAAPATPAPEAPALGS